MCQSCWCYFMENVSQQDCCKKIVVDTQKVGLNLHYEVKCKIASLQSQLLCSATGRLILVMFSLLMILLNLFCMCFKVKLFHIRFLLFHNRNKKCKWFLFFYWNSAKSPHFFHNMFGRYVCLLIQTLITSKCSPSLHTDIYS